MDSKIRNLLTKFEMNSPGVSDEMIRLTEEDLGFKFPQDYLAFMKESNGGEGHVGGEDDGGWLILEEFEVLSEMNEDYILLMEQYPEYFLIGKDSADTGYAIHKTNGTYSAFGLMSNRKTDGVDFVEESFEKFLENLSGIR